ncbi:hypothetical protein M3223_18040 [Paenibacillus pasadenensis]|uniref:hypothetical protein n=1 Tax=Paenibacillus pasadenensis TaxID=217090 RepID=UPI00203A73C5|nr:hypothetical protein [Paenibacillus pasadenensis]MCM3749262.1 hypothetical protein [Paenibacillus pasadenensis]
MEDELKLRNLLEKCTSTTDLIELRGLRRLLQVTLKQIDHSLEQQEPQARDPQKSCPECQSSNLRRHGSTPLPRVYCLDCNKAYAVNRQPLYYRRRQHDKIIDLIVEIHTTDKKTTEIINHLNISSKTYYMWRKDILSVFPQLEAKFKNRRKK